jgi:hypothetical protein
MDLSAYLSEQALAKLHTICLDNAWSQHPITLILDFLRLILSIEDGLKAKRLHHILFVKVGLASMALSER